MGLVINVGFNLARGRADRELVFFTSLCGLCAGIDRPSPHEVDIEKTTRFANLRQSGFSA
jgi:hypothetical protein